MPFPESATPPLRRSCGGAGIGSVKTNLCACGVLEGFYDFSITCTKTQQLSDISILGLCESVLATLDHLLRDPLPQFDRIERFVLGKASQNCELSPQHVSVGNRGDNLSRR